MDGVVLPLLRCVTFEGLLAGEWVQCTRCLIDLPQQGIDAESSSEEEEEAADALTPQDLEALAWGPAPM